MTSFNADALNKIAASNAFLNAAGNVTHGEGEKIETLDFGGNGNGVVVTDSDGETFELSLETVAEELGMSVDELKAQLKGDEAIKGPEAAAPADKVADAAPVEKTAPTEEVAKAGDVAKFEKELADLNAKKEAELAAMTDLEKEIEELAKDIEEKIAEAADKQEAKVEEHKEEVQEAIENNVAQYIADKKAGKNVTQEDLKAGINASLAAFPSIASVVSNLFVANSELNVLDANIARLKDMAGNIKDIDSQIATAQTNLNAAKEAEAAANCPPPTSCDPIGFQVMEDGQEVQYDFFVDKDGDGELSNPKEFLGAEDAEDGWNEMLGLNQDGDGKITYEELASAKVGEDGTVTFNEENIHGKSDDAEANKGQLMVMRTVKNSDGTTTQEAMTVEEAFGPDSRYGGKIDIGVAKSEPTDASSKPFDFDNENYDNKMLGNFNLTLGDSDEAIEGYQTLDDINYLNDKYEFSDNDEVGAVDKAPDAVADADKADGEEDPLAVHNLFIETYEEKAASLRTSLEDQWALYNLDEELLGIIDKNAASVAEVEAAKVDKEIEAEEAAKDEDEAKVDDTDEAGDAADVEKPADEAADPTEAEGTGEELDVLPKKTEEV